MSITNAVRELSQKYGRGYCLSPQHRAGYIILQKFECMFWHVIEVAQENKWYHWISEAKLHLLDTFFIVFDHI